MIRSMKVLSANLHESSPISIRDNSCQFVDKATQGWASATNGAASTLDTDDRNLEWDRKTNLCPNPRLANKPQP